MFAKINAFVQYVMILVLVCLVAALLHQVIPDLDDLRLFVDLVTSGAVF